IDEALEQIALSGGDLPTHVFLQAGVGSFAGSILGYLVSRFGVERPLTIIMEPENAACIFKSAAVGDGKAHFVEGDLSTIMSGLSCGEPNAISWGLLRDYADMYISCPDYIAARGVRILACPLGGDPPVVSGESGAVGMGLVSMLMEGKEPVELKKSLNLGEASRILLISTEGDTDPLDYRRIVWDGAYPTP
ncbi:MAG: pyridoxal-phosphate dependent enzyme, partial [Clostridia bacterium]|nr:pyridoxal-phosphate dependent enzyme [Clostridia bacterium]